MLSLDCNWRASIRSAAVVSFDVFDTLIARPFAEPSELFDAVGQALGIDGFRTLRIEGESLARRAAPDREDITFSDIYAAIVSAGLLSGQVAGLAAEKELELERALCGSRPAGRRLYDEVRASNPDALILAISDMYLPAAEVAGLLASNGYSFDRVFVSSEYGRSKHTGGLFDVVRAELDLYPTRWVHVGDNPWSDVLMAKSRGIRVVGMPYSASGVPTTRPSISTANHDRLAHLALEQANGLAWPDREFARLGAHVGAPLVVGLARQVKKDADASGADTLLFLGRDGYVIEEVYARLYPNDQRRRVRFAGSRRVVGLAALEGLDSAALSFLTGCKREVDLKRILARVGVTDPGALKAARACLTAPDAKDPPIHELVKAMHAAAPAILEEGRKARALLLAYLTQEGIDLSSSTHVVDIGWGCSIQTTLARLLRQEGWAVTLTGTYLGTKDDAPADVAINGWLFQRGLPTERMRTTFHCLELPELLFSAPEYAVERLAEVDGRIVPVRPRSAEEEGRIAAAAAMRPVVLAVAEWARRLEEAAPLLADRIYATDAVFPIYESVLRHPCVVLAEAVATVGHGEGIGETGHRPIVDPVAAQGTVTAAWRALRRSYWKEGVEAFLPTRRRLHLGLLVRFGAQVELGLHCRRRGLRGSILDLGWWGRRHYWRIPESTRFRIKRVVRGVLGRRASDAEAVS